VVSAAEKSSAGNSLRMPISKQRNKHLQTVLIEAAHISLRHHPEMVELYDREIASSNRNQAILAVARKMAGYLLTIDRDERTFVRRDKQNVAA
jgi:transposase